MSDGSLLGVTEEYLSKRVHLPVVKEEFFYPTEASVVIDTPHGEQVIGTCRRAAYYRYVGGFVGDPYSAYTHWVFLTGKSVENQLIEVWKQMGIWMDNNIKFRSKEQHISGEIDVVLRDGKGKPFIVECKTYAGYEAAKSLKGNPKYGKLGQPKDAHLLQVLIYLDLNKHIFEYAILVYVDKESKNNAEFHIKLSKEGNFTYPVVNGMVQRRFSVEDIYARFNTLRDFIEKKVLPPRDFQLEYTEKQIEQKFEAGLLSKTKYEEWKKKGKKPGDWNCGWCKYRKECYNLLDEKSTNK